MMPKRVMYACLFEKKKEYLYEGECSVSGGHDSMWALSAATLYHNASQHLLQMFHEDITSLPNFQISMLCRD